MNSEALKRARQTYRDKKKTGRISIEIPQEEIKEWKEKASKRGMTLTGYIRNLINKSAD